MRMRSFVLLLSAALGLSACYPDYVFDLAEGPETDAGASDDDGGIPDSSIEEGGSEAGLDGGGDAGEDADASEDPEGGTDGGEDADVDGGWDAGDDADSGSLPPPDPDCSQAPDGGATDYECVERPPTGWSGPVALYNDLSNLPVPSCPSLFTATPVFEGHAALDTESADCSVCSCSVSGVTCSAPTSEQFHSGSSCSGTCGWSPQGESGFKPGVCAGMTFPNAAQCAAPTSVDLGTSTPSGAASCTPSTQTPTISPVAWADKVRACHAPTSDKGCGGGSVCAPKVSHPFESSLCIVRIGEGDVSCPEGSYSQKHVFYRDAVDNRSCSDCQCGSATNVRCEGELKTYASTTGCANEDGSIPLGTCGDFPPAFAEGDGYAKWFRFIAQPKATCPASGGQPTGTVTPTKPQTICCMP